MQVTENLHGIRHLYQKLSKLVKSISFVEVRTPGEFAAGNIERSINIPLNEISARMNGFKKKAQPLIRRSTKPRPA